MALTRQIRRAVLAALVAGALIAPAAASAQVSSALPPPSGDGMWIWYVSRSGGTADAIAQQAFASGIDYVLIKSSDGASAWSQFTPDLVAQLHGYGLKVCAWQFVYGRDPTAEADVGAQAAAKGADCLVIDAESTYEGKYSAADAYMTRLRGQVGASYPLALSSFPYVDYHPGFPYSVFLAPGAAQYNLPQMYWRTIGTTVPAVYEHTYRVNRVYKRQIYPVGQTYLNPPLTEIAAFRQTALGYGAGGVSWWSWQETQPPEWQTLAATPVAGAAAAATYPVLGRGKRGDLVILAQELLRAARRKVPVTGIYGSRTVKAVKKFRRKKRLGRKGTIDARTWQRLMRRNPVVVHWASVGRSATGTGVEPPSAATPARGYEIAPGGGRG